MIHTGLFESLKSAGLQPFPYKESNKKGYFNSKYYYNKELTGSTAGNTENYFDIHKYFHCDKEDSHLGIFLKNGKHRKSNNGFMVLDFDLKNGDSFDVFDDIIFELKKKNLFKQVERKNNNKGLHVILRMTPEEIEKLEYQGKIHRGISSFVEILTAGKFVRLCPNKDYTVHNEMGHIDFQNVPFVDLATLMSLSKNEEDRLLKGSRDSFVKRTANLDIDFNIEYKENFETLEEKLLYSFIKSRKLSYDVAVRIAYGLGCRGYKELFANSIPEEVLPMYENLYVAGATSGQESTNFIDDLVKGLKLSKDKIKITGKYLEAKHIESIYKEKNENYKLVVAPTGTGKTYTFLNVAKKLGLKVIFTMPNKATVEQQSKTYDLPAAYDNKSIVGALSKSPIVICTLNKLVQIKEDYDLSDYILINDEAHTHTTTSDYRAEIIYEAMKMFKRFKKVIDVTATPDSLHSEDYDSVTRFVKADPIKYNAEVYVCKKGDKERGMTRKLIQVLDETEGNILCLNNDITFNDTYAEVRKDSVSWNSKTKNDALYQELVITNKIPKGIKKVLTTDIFSAGFNMNNTEKWTVVIKGVTDPTTIKQLVARFRKAKEIDIVLIVTERDVKELPKDFLIKKIRQEQSNKAEIMNLGDIAAVGQGFIQDDFFTYIDSKYEPFLPAINRNVWRLWHSKCSYDDLFSLFDADSITVTVDDTEVIEEGYDIEEELDEVKSMKKEIKELRRAKTIALLDSKKLNSLFYLDCKEYDASTIEKYAEYAQKYKLTHETAMELVKDPDLLTSVTYKILARHIEKDFKTNDRYRVARYCYIKLQVGDEIRSADIAEALKVKPKLVKDCLEAIWEMEERRTNSQRFKVLLNRNLDCILSKKQLNELLFSRVIFR